MGYYNSIEDLYIENYKLVYTCISDYTTDHQNAQDVAAIVWSKVAENPKRYLNMERDHLINYLRRMVKTAVSDFFTVEKRQFDKAEQAREALESAIILDEESFRKEQLFYLEQARGVLSEEELQLIYLRFDAGLSARAVGDAFGISEGAVRARQ
ncbi:MAG: sigma-70 family RNA polymerase sigma factor [Firmicutes bacterium]|jgi:RNA polymerase sigma factor (sigma-70 family)|nr:sigma-70 family RNA polymerase sigma factor [Bacillota bacterium]